MNLTMSLIKADIIAAKQAVDYYDKCKIKDIKNIAAYHLQQAAEKLIIYAQSFCFKFILPEYIDANSLVLTSWEAGSRYDINFKIRIDTLKKTLNVIDEWYNELYKIGYREAYFF